MLQAVSNCDRRVGLLTATIKDVERRIKEQAERGVELELQIGGAYLNRFYDTILLSLDSSSGYFGWFIVCWKRNHSHTSFSKDFEVLEVVGALAMAC